MRGFFFNSKLKIRSHKKSNLIHEQCYWSHLMTTPHLEGLAHMETIIGFLGVCLVKLWRDVIFTKMDVKSGS